MNRCPRCKVQTTRIEYEGAPVRICGQCGGYWVTRIALKAIANRRETEFNEVVQERFLQIAEESNSTEQLLCLTCGKHMVKEQFKDWDDIIIDLCKKCGGIWLDPGELEKIQIYWQYFQDHPEESNIDAIARKALLAEKMNQRQRDVKESAETLRNATRVGRFVPRAVFRGALRHMFGR
jgi:Zn-finger nucleic acid-binding protein